MPRRFVLSSSQREFFNALPTEPGEIAQHYTLSEADLMMVRQRRQAKNRVGFAIQLCLLRHPGRRLQKDDILPKKLMAYVSEQVDASPESFIEYGNREETRREHFLVLAKELGVQTFTRKDYRDICRWLLPLITLKAFSSLVQY